MKIKIPGMAIEDPEIQFVSLVKRGANREPFKILKSEDAPMSLKDKVAAFFKGESSLVAKVEGSTVAASTNGTPVTGEVEMKTPKLAEAMGGDLDGLLEKHESQTSHRVTVPDTVKKALVAKAGGRSYEYTLDKTGVPQFVRWVEKDESGEPCDHSYSNGVCTKCGADEPASEAASPPEKSTVKTEEEDAALAEQEKKRKEAEAAATEAAKSDDAEETDEEKKKKLDALAEANASKSETIKLQEALLKAMNKIDGLMEQVQKTSERVETLQKEVDKPKVVIKSYDADFNESFATPSMAQGRRRISKQETKGDVWAGLIPEFDKLEQSVRD